MPAKPPATVDRFKLSCEVEVSDLGAIIAQLTKMGLTNLHFELMTDVLNFRKKANHDIKASEFLRPWLADHPTFKAREAIKLFRDDGRTDGAGYSALRELTDEGVLKKLGEGNYARADVKAIAAPKKKAKPDKPAAPDRTRYAVPNPALIMRVAKRHKGTFTSKQMKKAFEKDGRPTGSVAPALTDLLGKKAIKRVGEGEYQIIEAPAPKTNGAPQEDGVTANG